MIDDLYGFTDAPAPVPPLISKLIKSSTACKIPVKLVRGSLGWSMGKFPHAYLGRLHNMGLGYMCCMSDILYNSVKLVWYCVSLNGHKHT